jgi:hypothetical protein
MTKAEVLKAALDKQKLNKARRLYLDCRAVNGLVDELQKRFCLLPILEDIEL